MESQTYDIGAEPKILVETIGGNFRLTAHDENIIEVRCRDHEDGEISVDEKKGELRISCPSDCHLSAPVGATIEAETVGGDFAITGIEGEVAVRTVGGDVVGRRSGQLTFETVGGSASIRAVAGHLSVDSMGGDARIDGVEGDARLRSIGGDLKLAQASGVVDINAGGDARVAFSPHGKQESSIAAGGDIDCHLGAEASVEVYLSVGGDLRLAVPSEMESTSKGSIVKLGKGEATLKLSSGGDLNLRSGGEGVNLDLGDAIAARIGAEMQAEMAELEVQLRDFGDRVESDFNTERIAQKMQRAVDKAQRKAEKARNRAERKMNKLSTRQVDINFGRQKRSSSMEEERLMILRMIEQGKISVEEAETLLQALEN
jgi:hypothetical protein